MASQLHRCSVYLRCLSLPLTSSVYSVLPDTLILPAALERTAEPWESVDTFLGESATLNFQRNVWADIRNWTSSGQQFIWAFCTNSHAYWDNCDCVRRLLTFVLPMWIITGSLRCHFRQSPKKVLFVQSSLLAYGDSSATVSNLSARCPVWWLIIPPLYVRTTKPSARLLLLYDGWSPERLPKAFQKPSIHPAPWADTQKHTFNTSASWAPLRSQDGHIHA